MNLKLNLAKNKVLRIADKLKSNVTASFIINGLTTSFIRLDVYKKGNYSGHHTKWKKSITVMVCSFLYLSYGNVLLVC